MQFYELISFSKVFSVAMGLDKRSILSTADIEITSEVLKHMADESVCWTCEQKELYKLMVDMAKEMTKQNAKEVQL